MTETKNVFDLAEQESAQEDAENYAGQAETEPENVDQEVSANAEENEAATESEESTQGADDNENDDSPPNRLPIWAKDRVERSKRRAEQLESELNNQRLRVLELENKLTKQPGTQPDKVDYDPQTQLIDPFSGQVVPIDSVEGRVILKLQQAAEIQAKEDEKKQKTDKEQKIKDKLAAGLNKFEDFREIVGNLPFTQTMLEAAALSDKADEFVYHLGKYNRSEVERIIKLSPNEQFKEIVLLDNKFKQMKPPAKPAAEPPTQVKSSGYIEKDPSRMSFEDLKALRKQERRW